MTSTPSAPMVNALVRLHSALKGAALPLELPEVDAVRTLRTEMVSQLEDYVLPRLIQIDAPLLAVVGGSTGAGKSTLVNSIVGEVVTEAGVLRPTTRSPVLVHNPADASWFTEARILPDFKRTDRASADPGAVQLVASKRVPEGLAILDAPDIDSVEQRNRELAAQLLAAADMWLFVTSAARYADQVPWEYLHKAVERSAAVAVVLDRTAPRAIGEVAAHLTRMMHARGLHDSPLFTVPECQRGEGLNDNGLLPAASVDRIQDWLEMLAADAEARSTIIRQTLGGAIRTIARRSYGIADAVEEQQQAVAGLRADVESAYEKAAERIDAASVDGTLLRGEVLASWREFVGGGDVLKSLESKVSWARDRLGRALRGDGGSAHRVNVAVESGLQSLIVEHAEVAAETSGDAWAQTPSGRALLKAASVDLSRASRAFAGSAEEMIRDWQRGVVDLVRAEGTTKRTSAKILAYGVNGLSVALMIVVFASTGGVTGAEVGIAGGSAVVGQRLLEAVFGDQAVRRLADRARKDLRRRVAVLLDAERRRYLTALTGVAVAPVAGEEIRALARRIDDLRYTEETL